MRSVRADASDVKFLAGMLNVLLGWDARSCIQLHIRESACGFYAAPPTGCVTFAAIPLIGENQRATRTVAAGRLRDVIGDVAQVSGEAELRIPDEVSTPVQLTGLPPSSGWSLVEFETAGEIKAQLEVQLAEFRDRVPRGSQLPSDVTDRVAQEIWSRQSWANVPVRALHTAHMLGWLARDDLRIAAGSAGDWVRVATPMGQVFSNSRSTNLSLPVVGG